MKSFIKRDCKYYDYGQTAPTAYGAFCAPHDGKSVQGMTHTLCKDCKDYIKRMDNEK